MDKPATIQWGGEPSAPSVFGVIPNAGRKTTAVAIVGGFKQLRGLSWLGNRAAFAVGMPALSGLAFVTSVYIPRLVSPVEFGAYALLLSLCRYASRCDFGLSQLADQRLSAQTVDATEVTHLLNVRFRVGLCLLLIGAPTAGLIGPSFGATSLDAIVAVAAGLCAMIAGGPATVFRAQGKTWEYTALAFLSGIGFIVPRLLGFAAGGVSGCFALWLFWNGTIAALCVACFVRLPSTNLNIAKTLRTSLPLFMFASGWTLYVTADRWLAAALSSPRDLGLFALGANIVAAGVVTFGQISDVRYPYWLRRISLGDRFQYSNSVEREACALGLLTTLAVACALPLLPYIILHIFPEYVGADRPMVALAISCVPTMVVAWFLPIAIARSRKPIFDAFIIFAPALLVMATGMTVGNNIAGVSGQAWACCLSAVVMLSGLAIVLHRCVVLNALSAIRAVAATSLMVGALALLAIALGPTRGDAANATKSPMPPLGWHRAFFDPFENLKTWDGRDGTWQAGYRNGMRTNPTNKELEFYASPFDRGLPVALQPFQVGPGGLTITARPTPSNALQSTGGLPYISGLLNTAHSFSFTYGYVVLRARLPKGRGLWPAFWLLPVVDKDPPELDVMEMIGQEPAVYYATLHSISGISMHTIAAPPLDEALHDFGVLWTSKRISWFFDGLPVAEADTPSDMHSRMYLLINLAVGGKWPGSPDRTTGFPAIMKISSVSVYQNKDGEETQRSRRRNDR